MVYEESHNVKQARKPGYNKYDVERLNAEHAQM
jgi:hypothetical protein